MITHISIDNFRSIKSQTIPLKKLNILYGTNGSGKSSVAYAPYVMRNLFVNPNQRLNSLFNLGFINLGGIDSIDNNSSYNGILKIKLNLELPLLKELTKNWEKSDAQVELTVYNMGIVLLKLIIGEIVGVVEYDLPISNLIIEEIELTPNKKVNWNGFEFVKVNNVGYSYLTHYFNEKIDFIKNIEVISVRRGFFNPIFSTEFAEDSESHFALQIRNEGVDFESKIDHYFQKLFNKTFRFVANPGSSYFYLKTQNKQGKTTDLVNEGFGVNQTVYMLAKLLKKNTSLAFIEEPEIHLHPSAQAKLVDCFIDIVQKENKQIFITTHSENIVSTVLTKIANGEVDINDVQFYLAKFEDGETKIIPQAVNDKGQIEGGLMNFMETELQNLKSMLGI